MAVALDVPDEPAGSRPTAGGEWPVRGIPVAAPRAGTVSSVPARCAGPPRPPRDIEPLHYVFDGEWLYGRTSQGAKLTATGELFRPVAFEVDEVEGIFSWRSVVVHGGFYTVTDDGPEWRQDAWKTGVERLRSLIPESFTSDDPMPARSVMFRIAAQDLTGREAAPAAGGPPP
jgi:hypothetical protein